MAATSNSTSFDELANVKAALRRQALENLETVVRENLDAMPADADDEAEIVFAINGVNSFRDK